MVRKNATPTGEPAVHFSSNLMSVASCPVAGMGAFSLVVVFKVDRPGFRDESGWAGKSGLVDANQPGITDDWGFAVRDTGYICFGTGTPGGTDQTVYLDNEPPYFSVVDGQYHVVACAWGGGSQTMYLDQLPPKSQSGVSTAPRGNAGMSFGGIHTGEATRQFVGDLAEVRFYDSALSALEASNVIAALTYTYLDRPPARTSHP